MSLLVDKEQRAGSVAHWDELMSYSYPALAMQGTPTSPRWRIPFILEDSDQSPFTMSLSVSLNSYCIYFGPTATLSWSASASLSCLLNQAVDPLRAVLCLIYLGVSPLPPPPTLQHSASHKVGC